jgi:hypothetical protein
MSNISQANNYTKIKQLTNRDSEILKSTVYDCEEFTSTMSQTTLNLSKITCNLSQKKHIQVYVDGKLLREGIGNDYQWTQVSGNMSSQITFEYALPADLNIIVTRVGAVSDTISNSAQSEVELQKTELKQKDNVNGIINGCFEFWQRGTSFPAIAVLGYSSDRWQYSKSSTAVHTISRSTDVPTNAFGQYSMLIDCTTADISIAAGDFCSIRQNIEGNFFRRFRNKNIVFKFWVKATKTGISCVSFRNFDGSRSIVKEYTINASNTWEQKTIRFTHDSTGTWLYDNGIGMRVEWSLMAGTNFQTIPNSWQNGNFLATSSQVNHTDNTANDFQLADVHFCEDSLDQTKDPEFQLAAQNMTKEFHLCQRYYEIITIGTAGTPCYNTAGANRYAKTLSFKTTKRITPAPTILVEPGEYSNCSALNIVVDDVSTTRHRVTVTTLGPYYVSNYSVGYSSEL